MVAVVLLAVVLLERPSFLVFRQVVISGRKRPKEGIDQSHRLVSCLILSAHLSPYSTHTPRDHARTYTFFFFF